MYLSVHIIICLYGETFRSSLTTMCSSLFHLIFTVLSMYWNTEPVGRSRALHHGLPFLLTTFLSTFFHLFLVCLSSTSPCRTFPRVTFLSYLLYLLSTGPPQRLPPLPLTCRYSSSVCALFTCLPSTFFSKPPRTCLLGFLYLSLTCSAPVPVSPALHLFLVFRSPLSRPSRAPLPRFCQSYFTLTFLSFFPHLSRTCPSPASHLSIACCFFSPSRITWLIFLFLETNWYVRLMMIWGEIFL